MLPTLSLAAVLALPAMVLGAPTTKPFPADLATEVVPETDGEFSTTGKLIVGGVEASSGEFPYIVSLSSGGSHFCGGTLLNAYTVITAAHCSTGTSPSSVRVRAGSLVGVSQIVVHPSYSSSNINNDIALWHLSSPIQAGSGIGYVTLPASGSDPAAGTLTTVAGWGTTSSGSSTLPATLRKVTVPVISRDTCRARYGTSAITTAMFCAGETNGGEDSCQGDSGGPIVAESSRVMQGIVSWGNGCAQAQYPGVYTRVGNFVSWINSNSWTS